MRTSTRPAPGISSALDLLFSLRFGLILLALVTVASIVGTLIPEDPATGQSALDRSRELVFTTGWFGALLVLLAINMGGATLHNIRHRILPSYRPRFMNNPGFYAAARPGMRLAWTEGIEPVVTAFRRRRFRVMTDGESGFARRGTLRRWGAPIAHLGVIMVLVGGFASALVSREGMVSIVEGTETSIMMVRDRVNEQAPLGFTLRCDDFEVSFFPQTQMASVYRSTVTVLEEGKPPRVEPVEVNRSLKVDGWSLHQTGYQEIPGQQRYRLALGHDELLATTVTLELSPGQQRPIPELPGFQLALANPAAGGWSVRHEGKPLAQGGFGATGTGAGLSVRADQFEPDFMIGADRVAGSRSEALNNPALRVTLLRNGAPDNQQWLFGREDLRAMMHTATEGPQLELTRIEPEGNTLRFIVSLKQDSAPPVELELALGQTVSLPAASAPSAAAGGPWRVRLQETVPAYRTDMTIGRNPALPFIYLGCLVMMVGLIVAFFVRRREVWFWLDTGKGVLQIAAPDPQNPDQFDPATAAVLRELEARHTPSSNTAQQEPQA